MDADNLIVNKKMSLTYLQHFISKEKEKEIFMFLNDYLFKNSGLFCKKTESRNKILRFGSKFPYPSDHTLLPIPNIFKYILSPEINFTSVTINEYFSGQKISYHTDAPPTEKIYILSLCSSAILKFRNKINKKEIIDFDLEPLSLIILEGDLRWNYEHSLEANDYRISIVFR